MFYAKDWEMTKKRWKAAWNNEIVDRCIVTVTAPKNNVKFSKPKKINENDFNRYWTDAEWILDRKMKEFDNTYFAGDAFASIFLNLGVAAHAGFFKGAKYHYADECIWFSPSMESYEDELIYDKESHLYRKTIEIASYLVKEGQHRFVVSMPDVTGNMDALAHLRGSENVLMDMLIHKEQIKESMKKIEIAFENIMSDVYDIVKDNNQGGSHIGWMQTWAPGLHAQMQSDISVMISPAMYEEFIMPELKAQSQFLDYPLYHFDGVDQVKHLDLLLSLPELKMIQWTNVDGRPSVTNYIPTLKKMQEAGKGVLIFAKPDQIELLMSELSSKGLVINTWANSEEEADEIVKKVEKWTHE